MKVQDIDITLSDGQLQTGSRIFLLGLGLSLAMIYPIITIIIAIGYSFIMQEQGIWLFIFLNTVCIAFFIICLWALLKNRTLAKEIDKWLEDARETTAISRLVGEYYMGMQPKVGKIEITFWLDGKRYVRESTAKGWGGQKGYMACFRKYAERNVRILYSAKYDKVMIPKDQTCISGKE